jgi:hypothetical protein
MFELKAISKEAIPRALEKAERYRLLNEPAEAESICLDILRTDPEHQQALVMLLLALTDRFRRPYGVSGTRPEEILPRLKSDYERAYYAGVIEERRTKAWLHRGQSGGDVYQGFRDAMAWYEKAAALRPASNEDALLRWNACARLLMHNQPGGPEAPVRHEPELE